MNIQIAVAILGEPVKIKNATAFNTMMPVVDKVMDWLTS